MNSAISMICVLGFMYCPLEAYAEDEADAPIERFAFGDAYGQHLVLQTDRSFETQFLTRAICNGGKSVAVTAVDMADVSHGHGADYQDSDKNFHDLWGAVYHVGEPGVRASDTCLLIDQSTFEANSILPPLPGSRTQCDERLKGRIAIDRERVIAQCDILASFADGSRVTLVEYVAQGKHLLASLTISAPNFLAHYLMPAKSGTGSAWRVDDEEEISADDFEVLFGLNGPEGAAVAISWAGAEGTNLGLYEVQGETFEIVAAGYRYYQFPNAQ